jgi:hypothetical protein
MKGDARVRFCETCGKDVYNFAALTEAEAIALVDGQEIDLCGRLTHASDRTLVILDDGRAPGRVAGSRWSFHIRSLMAVIAGVAGTLGLSRLVGWEAPTPPLNSTPRGMQVTGGKVCLRPSRSIPIAAAPDAQGARPFAQASEVPPPAAVEP